MGRGWRDCHCNDKPPSATIYFYELLGQINYQSCEVGICAEDPNGNWINFKFYSIPVNRVIEKLPEFIKKLKKAWSVL